jgi:hypothetical protein
MIVDRQRHVFVTGDMDPGDVRREPVEEGFRRLSEPALSHQ